MQGNELQEFCWVGGMWKDSLEETRPAVNMDLHWGHYNELIQPMTNWTKHIHSLVSEQMTMIKYKDTSDIGLVGSERSAAVWYGLFTSSLGWLT